MPEPGTDFWVFAYGSLLWNPGFVAAESVPARLYGWHRAMCILSLHYRGRPDAPGLVLGLDRGGSCRGLAYRIDGDTAPAIRQALLDREMVSGVYRPQLAPTHLEDGRTVVALFFPARTDHPQYTGRLSPSAQATLIRQGVGSAGRATDYLANTVASLNRLGLFDRCLNRLLRLCTAPQP